MKFKKKLWISLILFILFGTVFSGWIFHQNTTREYLVFDNTTQLVTTERSEDNIRIEDVILPDSFSGAVLPENNNQHKRSEHRSPFLPVYARCLNATKNHASDSREPYMIPSDFP